MSRCRRDLAGKLVAVQNLRDLDRGEDQHQRDGASGEEAAFDVGQLVAATVPAGSYTLKARMSADKSWHLLVDAGEKRVAEVPLMTKDASESAEALTISLDADGKGGLMRIHWAKVVLATPFTAG